MFPFEIITMLGSTLLSSVLSLWSQRMKAKQDEQKMLITRGEFQLKAVESARNVDNEGFNGQDVSLPYRLSLQSLYYLNW